MQRANPFAWIALSLWLNGCATPVLEPMHLTTPRQEYGTPTLSYDSPVEATRQVSTHTPIDGTISALDVAPGARVRAGQVVVRLDSSTVEAALKINESQRTRTLANIQKLEKQLHQFSRQAGSSRRAVEVQTALDAATSELAIFTEHHTALRQRLAQHQITAPQDGVVGQITVTLGQPVMPGQEVLTVFDPYSLRILVAAPALLNARAPQGSGVRIELPTQGAALRWVKPNRVQSLPDPQGATHRSLWQLDLPAFAGEARPGMVARVWLPQTSETFPGARVFVPASAVTRRLNMTLVYVLDDRAHPVPRTVTVGPSHNPLEVEVFSGLAPHEQVVVNPRAAEQRLQR